MPMHGYEFLPVRDWMRDNGVRSESRPEYDDACNQIGLMMLTPNPAATNTTMEVCQVPQQSQEHITPILAGVFGMLALIMVSLRVIQRVVFSRVFWWDDALCVAALLCAGPLNCVMFPSESSLCQKLPIMRLTPGSEKVRIGTEYLDHSF